MSSQTPYSKYQKIHLAVDCIIFGFDGTTLKILLVKRGLEPEIGKWSLMGGFVRENQSIDDEAMVVLKKLTGLSNIFMKQLYVYGEVNRDPISRVASVVYYALINIHTHDKNLLKEHGAQWFPVNQIPELIFDHKEMVNKALSALKADTQSRPIGFELLPKNFTIPQLKTLYDCITGKNHDVRNFSKKILSTGMLKKLDKKDFSTSKKGAYLYSFDSKRYQKLQKEGFTFVF